MFRQIFGTREIPVHTTLTILMVISEPSQSLPTLKNIVNHFYSISHNRTFLFYSFECCTILETKMHLSDRISRVSLFQIRRHENEHKKLWLPIIQQSIIFLSCTESKTLIKSYPQEGKNRFMFHCYINLIVKVCSQIHLAHYMIWQRDIIEYQIRRNIDFAFHSV